MASSSNLPEVTPPWLELPREVTAMILQKLGAVEILIAAEKVCPTWRSVCQDPAMWRRIDMRCNHRTSKQDSEKMCRDAVDRNLGQLIDIRIQCFASDDLLLYILQRSSELRCLELASCHRMSGAMMSEAIKNFPCWRNFTCTKHLFLGTLGTIKFVGRHCPNLKSFRLNRQWSDYSSAVENGSLQWLLDLEAVEIGENMPGLCHLQLLGNSITNDGLKAILDGCPDLESLDLRLCLHVDLGGDLGRLCQQRIKHLRHPIDIIDDFEFYFEHYYPHLDGIRDAAIDDD